MAKDYLPTLNTAKRLIQEFGRQLTFYKLDNVSVDVDKPWLGAASPTATALTEAVYGVSVQPSSEVKLGFSAIPDDLLKNTEQVFIVEHGQEDLSTFTTLVDTDTEEYRIIYVERLKPGDTTLLYFIWAGR